MITQLLPLPIFRAFDNSTGSRLAGGLSYSYAANNTTPQNMYSDVACAVPNTNPVVLDTAGSAAVRLDPSLTYKFVLLNANGDVQWTEDEYVPAPVPLPYYAINAAEIALSVTPPNTQYPVGHAWRYLSAAQISDAQAFGFSLDSTTALQNAINCSYTSFVDLYVPGGGYLAGC
jgi:hypothetical protein